MHQTRTSYLEEHAPGSTFAERVLAGCITPACDADLASPLARRWSTPPLCATDKPSMPVRAGPAPCAPDVYRAPKDTCMERAVIHPDQPAPPAEHSGTARKPLVLKQASLGPHMCLQHVCYRCPHAEYYRRSANTLCMSKQLCQDFTAVHAHTGLRACSQCAPGHQL